MFNKNLRRKRIRQRIRKKMTGTGSRPRMSVFRSNKSIYCQLIDDVHGKTLISASSKENDIEKEGSKVEQAKKVGKLIGEKAQSQKITEVVFDRGGYLYHGRVQSLAEGAREAGLKI